ncbi:hypothetical protein [Arthrobacter sp. GMC3]|uniref:hypothetical protein n=1 Tax=Arthrobacter sp. GMC3 TaxID=2058894 RepID=UPI000CE47EED|nr:hypothetical protein [Arthrobacter sp. GMC3]
MKVAVKPRSDQWNADDFTGGPRTFTIAGAKHGTAEALYDIELAEGEGRVWRPPNGMLSVLIQLWGDEASEWIGRRVTLFKDPSVRVGKDVPGGIRISHMSDIGPKGASPSITVSRGQRRPYPVKPLLDPVQRNWQQEILTATDTATLNQLWTEAPAEYQAAMMARAEQLKTPTEGVEA